LYQLLNATLNFVYLSQIYIQNFVTVQYHMIKSNNLQMKDCGSNQLNVGTYLFHSLWHETVLEYT